MTIYWCGSGALPKQVMHHPTPRLLAVEFHLIKSWFHASWVCIDNCCLRGCYPRTGLCRSFFRKAPVNPHRSTTANQGSAVPRSTLSPMESVSSLFGITPVKQEKPEWEETCWKNEGTQQECEETWQGQRSKHEQLKSCMCRKMPKKLPRGKYFKLESCSGFTSQTSLFFLNALWRLY